MGRATNDVAKTTPEVSEERLRALRDLLPEAFTEESCALELFDGPLAPASATSRAPCPSTSLTL